jgi:hypothetical protein
VRSSTTRGNSRASSVRSAATAASSLTARGITVPEREALAHLHALATSPVRCTNPGCGTLIPPVSLDSVCPSSSCNRCSRLTDILYNADSVPHNL